MADGASPMRSTPARPRAVALARRWFGFALALSVTTAAGCRAATEDSTGAHVTVDASIEPSSSTGGAAVMTTSSAAGPAVSTTDVATMVATLVGDRPAASSPSRCGTGSRRT